MGNFLRLVNGVMRSYSESSSTAIYDQATDVASPISSGMSITLPASQTYTGAELNVYLNGVKMEPTVDYTYVGSPLRTQVQMTFDLVIGDRLRFIITRGP